MRWQPLRRSSNVDDIRGRRMFGGAGLPLRVGGGGGLIVLVLLAIMYIAGGTDTLDRIGGGGAPAVGEVAGTNDEASQFVRAILGSTEDEWRRVFAESGNTYTPPRLTMFSDAVQSACGFSSSAVGPFYCPPDRRVYLDVTFFDELARMGGQGDFAAAYVIGHEIGHHVQTLLGTADQVRNMQARAGEVEANRWQVAMELQADCYAGVWANRANRNEALLEPGDVEEGLDAASAIGDDRLQRAAGRRVTPDSFTHGSSGERQQWLRVGLETGDPEACDTFQ